jgi:Protein of unknown function (DUF1566)
MIRLLTFLSIILIMTPVFTQSPEKMSYQAVIRNANNNLVTSHSIGMKISILQGTVSGTAIYVETQNPGTNANGLVSIEIGGGTVVSGNFATIDWAHGPYFIQTETDPAGGTNYSITGTNQLLSVPYALHAKTAATVIENDPVYSGSQAANITATDITNLNNLSGLFYAVGDFAQGGIVFWVDETGQHGLVCAANDAQSAEVRWDAGTSTFTMALGDGPLSGKMNTAIIIANQGRGDGATYAARICNELKVTQGGKTYGDWYLPSKEELNLIYQNKVIINAVAIANGGDMNLFAYYWSSTEGSSNSAWAQYFNGGLQFIRIKTTASYVRAVRSF